MILFTMYVCMYCIVLYCIVLYCIVLYCIVLYCIALHCVALRCVALHCIALHCIALHCIALHCIALHCIALHCIALHCIHACMHVCIHTYTILKDKRQTLDYFMLNLLLSLWSSQSNKNEVRRDTPKKRWMNGVGFKKIFCFHQSPEHNRLRYLLR